MSRVCIEENISTYVSELSLLKDMVIQFTNILR